MVYTTRTTRKPPFRQLCSSFLSVADEMLFRQLHYSHESYQSKGLPSTTLLTNSTSVSNGMLFHHAVVRLLRVLPSDRIPSNEMQPSNVLHFISLKRIPFSI